MDMRKLKDHPEDLHDLRNLVAKALGAPVEPPSVTLYARVRSLWQRLSRRLATAVRLWRLRG